mmetsp:Transcript_30959/g.62817  ORF Transcript_30959/g.62817 Transcript_30959/m.62817 type:complete len:106 (-) Transcript_30959:213-530(-)|eukprot:CAMPEP_0202808500 /NCGR_PEP_ID=MMETSP1389-20130828/1017_1 /ASSEMBLY_ACC=CAM_ASM_000865 /TAXON_ID=302021 /ORGANISM="Rhodomonas sp., Strain CCMP768" /LENGTH=105 /DNA_ID=CAMNT_0049478839 /DNA_START=54 /DNA_END=371 /DNA_ORIENTATION=-
MVFVENGRVVDRRSLMRTSTLGDMFWAFLNALSCFFHSMFSPEAASDYQNNRYRVFGPGGPGGGGGGGGGPFGGGGGSSSRRGGANLHGMQRFDNVDAPPMVGGG